MNKLLFAIVLILGAPFCVTGCNKSGTTDQATKKAEPSKTEDKKPQDKPAETAKAKDLIIGRWEGTDSKGKPCAVEFTAFGTVKTVRPDRGSGKYMAKDDGDLDMEFGSADKAESQKCKIKVSDGELSVTDLDGKSLEALFVMPGQYKKVKTFSAAVRPVSDLILGRWKGNYVVGEKGSGWAILEFKKGGDFVWHLYFKRKNDNTPDNQIEPTSTLGRYTIGLEQASNPQPVLEINIPGPSIRNSFTFKVNETELDLYDRGDARTSFSVVWKRE